MKQNNGHGSCQLRSLTLSKRRHVTVEYERRELVGECSRRCELMYDELYAADDIHED
jgi:hypothetical protein